MVEVTLKKARLWYNESGKLQSYGPGKTSIPKAMHEGLRKHDPSVLIGDEPTLSATPLPFNTPHYDKLYESGLTTTEAVMSDPDLTRIDGIGAATKKKIRQHLLA